MTQSHAKAEDNAEEENEFPDVPGDTPREKFINLVRHVFTAPKAKTKTPPKRTANGNIDNGKEAASSGVNDTGPTAFEQTHVLNIVLSAFLPDYWPATATQG